MLRDSAHRFEAANCVILGASFDTIEENRAFAEAQELDYPLLSDVDQSVGRQYEVVRDDDERFASFPKRISYLIDPDGVVAKAYDVTDVARHADVVLHDLEQLSSRSS